MGSLKYIFCDLTERLPNSNSNLSWSQAAVFFSLYIKKTMRSEPVAQAAALQGGVRSIRYIDRLVLRSAVPDAIKKHKNIYKN